MVDLLKPWAAPLPDFFLCYLRHRQMPPALRAVVDAIVARFGTAESLLDQAVPT